MAGRRAGAPEDFDGGRDLVEARRLPWLPPDADLLALALGCGLLALGQAAGGWVDALLLSFGAGVSSLVTARRRPAGARRDADPAWDFGWFDVGLAGFSGDDSGGISGCSDAGFSGWSGGGDYGCVAGY